LPDFSLSPTAHANRRPHADTGKTDLFKPQNRAKNTNSSRFVDAGPLLSGRCAKYILVYLDTFSGKTHSRKTSAWNPSKISPFADLQL